MDVRKV